jgi:hypothetical protein
MLQVLTSVIQFRGEIPNAVFLNKKVLLVSECCLSKFFCTKVVPFCQSTDSIRGGINLFPSSS